MTDTSTLSDIATGRPVETALLEKASADCPYFAAPLLASLRAETDPEARRRLKMKLAALVGNRKVLAVLFGEEPEEFLAFYPDEIRPSLSTDDTISSFLERYGDTTESQTEGDVIPIEAPAMDYAAAFLADDPADYSPSPSDATSAALDAFLAERPAPMPRQTPAEAPRPAPVPAREAPRPVREVSGEHTPESRPAPAKAPETPALTESFAQIMIKNHNYGKALEIIEAMRLNNPEKSIYFADQIRFLRKLIAIESKKQQNK